jgi:aminopeptidase N
MIKFKKPFLITAILFFVVSLSFSQSKIKEDTGPKSIYRATPSKINDLVHTKLDVKFDYAKTYLYGKAWLTLKPHFYPTDSLTLDAKGMDIKSVALVEGTKNKPLKYNYDGLLLKVNLDKTYKAANNYTIYIDYTSKPNEFKSKGSAAITDAKGLYFINPDSLVKGKPVQIWTQGETEGSSVWFPTIDKPNQKTTQEISMTVPAKYVTLSNGALVAQKKNTDGTRTDTWKMDKPHSPYLFMMAVGNFKIYRDKWNNIPVDYYLEPAFAPYAKDIFGKTPAMMDFYSKKLGIDYPWNKYAQIVVKDFVSGAMENTTATLHADYVQQTPRELLDGSAGEETIAHELFHHWFGDYVTAESWSNLSVNESFADYSETLWLEHAYGKDAGDAHNYESMQAYLADPSAKAKHLIRFDYTDKEDMFDVVSYQKGGRVLNMLRNYLGEAAFFKGLNLYLKTNALGNGEAHQLRLALEQVSGKDLNWFFNQWYFNAGNPELKIDYKWNAATKTQTVYLTQTQKENVFQLPMKIDIYTNGKKETRDYWMSNKTDSVSFQLSEQPSLVNVDAEKVLLVKKTDNKTIEEFAFQFKNAPLFVDRNEALAAAAENLKDKAAQEIIISALKDPYFEIRIAAIELLDLKNPQISSQVLPTILNLAKTDPKTLVRAAAINAIGALKDKTYIALFRIAVKDQSYAISAVGLNSLSVLEETEALSLATFLEKDSKGPLSAAIVDLYTTKGTEANFPFVNKAFAEISINDKFPLVPAFSAMLFKVNNLDDFKSGVDQLKQLGIQYKTYGIDKYAISTLTNIQTNKTTQLTKLELLAKTNLESQIAYTQAAIEYLKAL